MNNEIWILILILLIAGILVFAIRSGLIGVKGGTIHKRDYPGLFWFVIIGTIAILCMGVVVMLL